MQVCCLSKSGQRLSIKGFTLIEVLIVIAIIGIFVSVTVLNLGDGGLSRKVEDEALRMNALIKLAQEVSILNTREMSLELTQDGYQFKQFKDKKWQSIDDDVFRDRKLAAGIELELELENSSKFKFRLDSPSKESSDENDDSNKDSNNDDDIGEVIFFFSSGEILPPFIMRFSSDLLDVPYELHGYANGETEIKSPDV